MISLVGGVTLSALVGNAADARTAPAHCNISRRVRTIAFVSGGISSC